MTTTTASTSTTTTTTINNTNNDNNDNLAGELLEKKGNLDVSLFH